MQSKEFKDYICITVSTLNQMVNYIPLKHFEFKEVYNLTIDDSEYADNSKWDKNLKEFFPNIQDISFKQSQMGNIKAINRKLRQFNGKRVFWNITGGQRSFILAINQLIEKDDVICYLEGNKNRLILLKDNQEKKNIIKDYSLDKFEDLNIEIALKLMGFDIKITKTSERNFVTKHDPTEKTLYLDFWDKYIADKKLRENLILLNRDSEKDRAKKEIKKIINLSDKELDRNKAFGFILEKLAGYKILDLAGSKIADMTLGEKINFLDKKSQVNKSHIDEFDIALLTKNGKFMIFECKSGGMEGDVAKSTKYSTYAVSGAYGLPILITPLLKDEIENIDDLDSKIYGYIQSAIKSGKRASLDVWGLDEICEKLAKYIDIEKTKCK
jgi:hypothetical protein